ncbi:hypothetical protein PO77_11420, partial [Vibrio parahaemolyticus]
GRSYADRGFTGLLLKLNKDFDIEDFKVVEINNYFSELLNTDKENIIMYFTEGRGVKSSFCTVFVP